MSVSRPDKQRRLLPRWQPSDTTIAMGELRAVRASAPRKIDDAHFDARKAEWNTTRSIDVAAELVASAIVLGRTDEIEAAARLLAENDSDVSATLREMARDALSENPPVPAERAHRTGHGPARPVLYAQISQIRHYLHANPRDAYAWMDIARLYTVLGQHAAARRAIRTAQALAPEDRFVLRAGARFFVHVDEPDVAQRLLNRARATRQDPWLMSAEIAVAQVIERPSRTASLAARGLKEDAWTPRSSSELAGSFATLLMEDGAAAKARGFFRQSLRDPTENAVAQAQWAAGTTTGLVIPAQLFHDPNGHEARALRDSLAGDWDNAIERCWDWAEYEPTSSRPTIMGSYIAAVAREDSETILAFAEHGLAAEPHNPTLLNNKAVGLVYADRVPDAIEVMHQVVIDKAPNFAQPALYATMGLLFFRSGDLTNGRLFYDKAITHPYARSDRRCLALALWHLAREEVRVQAAESDAVIARAEKASKDLDVAELDAVRERVLKAAKKPIKSHRRPKKIFPM